MPQKIRIIAGAVIAQGELADTECARAIAKKLPFETVPNEWGDEFYFTIPVKLPLDATATGKVKVGDIGYWPPGSALAIFFGRTPMSTGPDPVPASEVNLVGRITSDALLLKKAKGASTIRIEKE
jgi:hypothetical protein